MLDQKDEHVVHPAEQKEGLAEDQVDHAQPEGHLKQYKANVGRNYVEP